MLLIRLRRSCFKAPLIVRCYKNQKVTTDSNTVHIKSGYYVNVPLKSGKIITIVRPPELKSIDISKDSFETDLESRIEADVGKRPFQPFLSDNRPMDNVDITESQDKSVSDLMSHSMSPRMLSPTKLMQVYSKLAKVRLTTLVVISSVAGWMMCPGVFDAINLVQCCAGTFLISASANTINQILEIPYDSQMNRTRNRPLVLGVISPLHAALFAGVSVVLGTSLLLQCSTPAALLGLVNLGLYTAVYTPLKRYSVANTWVGSLVGGVPPLIGWAALTGGLDSGALLLAGILYCWQFPHFMSLSWNLRQDYSRAGYRMASVVRPRLCTVASLRHSLLLSGLCVASSTLPTSLGGLTDPFFVLHSLPLSLGLVWLAGCFHAQPDSDSSRRLFRFSLVHLPALIVLMILCKRHHLDDDDGNEIGTVTTTATTCDPG